MAAKWVTIAHPDTGGVCKVHPDSLTMWVSKGWKVQSELVAPLSGPPERPISLEKPWWETISDPDDIE